MNSFKQKIWMLFLICLVFAAWAKGAVEQSTRTVAQEKSVILFQNEEEVIEQFKVLKEKGKIEEALALLDQGLKQYPESMNLIKEKYRILFQLNRFQDCLKILNDLMARLPEQKRGNIRTAKHVVLFKLIEAEIKNKNSQKAFEYLQGLADSGYRRFHHLKNDDIYQPLREMSGFSDVMAKIAHNTGIGQPAKDFTCTLMTGETFTLSKQKGTVVLVDFWSTKCPPCIEEIPNLKKLYNIYKDKNFEIISISLDDKKEELDAFLTNQPMSWKMVFSGKGWGDETAGLYKISSIPSLWLVDRKGILRYFDVRGEDLKIAIDKLTQD